MLFIGTEYCKDLSKKIIQSLPHMKKALMSKNLFYETRSVVSVRRSCPMSDSKSASAGPPCQYFDSRQLCYSELRLPSRSDACHQTERSVAGHLLAQYLSTSLQCTQKLIFVLFQLRTVRFFEFFTIKNKKVNNCVLKLGIFFNSNA